MNLVSSFNEVIGLTIVYLLLPLQNKEYDPEQHYDMAYVPIYAIYTCGSINLIVLIGLALRDFHITARRFFLHRCRKKPKQQKAPIIDIAVGSLPSERSSPRKIEMAI